MKPSSDSDDLWKSALAASPAFRHWTELYPSLERRLGMILERAHPRLRAAAESLLRTRDEDPEGTGPPPLAARFGLTPAEEELTAGLVAGESLSDYAGRRGVRVQTVRNQLQSVFQKTGVNRQSDLVRLMLIAAEPGQPDAPAND